MKKVLVIGDGCKDVFQYGKCDRLSPEAPVPIFKPTKKNHNSGMAMNVYANLLALGVECDIITDSGITKTRYVDETSNQMLLRVDENDEVDEVTVERLADIDFKKYDAIVVSDYNKGFLDIDDIEYLTENHNHVFMDTKKEISIWCSNIFCIKVNNKEYQRNQAWLDHMFENNVIITLGDKGAMYSNLKKKIVQHLISINEDHPVRDLSGAGDTFMAALVAKYLENKNMEKAIDFANKCASWVVTQKGVVTIDLNKIQ
ncbi:MAG: PfkB family carbohydrate kinase [Candidatus Paceibacterota bacterium]|jgi:D-beta-D-heptose 7-phosphate kinase/D-beta-D-heptose 1-phosphate adenosyltransferase